MRSSGSNCRLIDCFATACRDGAAVSTAACIRNCRFVGNTRHGVVVVGTGTNMEFVGNTIADNGGTGIKSAQAKQDFQAAMAAYNVALATAKALLGGAQ